jgi:hypothetical protein
MLVSNSMSNPAKSFLELQDVKVPAKSIVMREKEIIVS